MRNLLEMDSPDNASAGGPQNTCAGPQSWPELLGDGEGRGVHSLWGADPTTGKFKDTTSFTKVYT